MFVVKLSLWVDLKEEPFHPLCAVSLSHTHSVLALERSALFLFPHKPNYKLFSIVSSCVSRFSWRHRWHIVRVALRVPGGVADSASGLGGVVSELRDLLQGAGDQLQGESPGKQSARRSTVHTNKATPKYRIGCRGQCLQTQVVLWMMCTITSCQTCFYALLDVGVRGPLWRWDRLHSTSRGHAFYAVPSRGVHPCCVPRGPAWTATPPASCTRRRLDTSRLNSRPVKIDWPQNVQFETCYLAQTSLNLCCGWFHRGTRGLPGSTSQPELYPRDRQRLVWPGNLREYNNSLWIRAVWSQPASNSSSSSIVSFPLCFVVVIYCFTYFNMSYV